MEDDIVAVDPASAAADPLRVEFRQPLRTLDQRVDCLIPALAGEVTALGILGLPCVEHCQPHKVVLGVAGCGEADDLLALVRHVKKRVAVHAKQPERQAFDPVILPRLSLWYRRRLPRLDLVLRRLLLGHRIGPRLDRGHQVLTCPVLGHRVGQIPAVVRSRRRCDDTDLGGHPGERLGDRVRRLHAWRVPVRPDDDLSARERRPVGVFDGLPSTRPRHNDTGRDRPCRVGSFLPLHDQHAGRRVGGEQVEAVERAGFGERQPAPVGATKSVPRPCQRHHLLRAVP